MKKVCFFDALVIFALICLSFTVGFHLGKGRESETVTSSEITLRLYRSKIPDSLSETELRIDGRYECELAALDAESLTVRICGTYREAGFLVSGAKYISKNQPIEIIGEGAYFFGRITKISQ